MDGVRYRGRGIVYVLVDVSGVMLQGNVVELGREFKCLIDTHCEGVIPFLSREQKIVCAYTSVYTSD